MQREVDMKLAHQLQRQYLQSHLLQVQQSPNISLPLLDFDRHNPQQTFYKQLLRLNQTYLQSHIGLRVTRLQRQQQDLAFYCLAYLQAEIDFPLKVFVINRNEVWVETTLMKRQAEDTVEENEMEKRVYRFLQDARERIVGFVNRNIVWDRMIREDYKDTKVIQKFKEEVIEQVKAQFKKIMGKK